VNVDHLDAIRKHVAAVIAANEGFGEELARRARAKEAEGFRIVDGGQTGPHVEGLAPWELSDWRTGEVVATGNGLDSFQAIFESERWWHVDSLNYEPVVPVPASGGLPPGLARALANWAATDPVGAEVWLEASAPPV
jgi:hypothetical protein